MHRSAFRCSLSGAAYFPTWHRNGGARAVATFGERAVQTQNQRSVEKSRFAGDDGLAHIVWSPKKGEQPNVKGFARSPVDARFRELLTLPIESQLMPKGQFSVLGTSCTAG
ncbi:unnamed protein product, partial [Ectocarpus sp. 8 AP-2014]